MNRLLKHYCLTVGAALLLMLCGLAVAQEPTSSQEAPAAQEIRGSHEAPATEGKAQSDYCKGIAGSMAHADVFANFCGLVLSFDKHLPDIIGDQDTRRFKTENGKDRQLIDTTNARIAYIAGRARFSEVEINHVKIPQSEDSNALLKIHGAWSYTEYGTDLRLLFRLHGETRFYFANESTWHDIPVFVFGYEVKENHWWQLKDREKIGAPLQTALPSYEGRILLDKKTGSLVRFERQTTEIEKHFPLRYGSNEVDYKVLPLGDGTSFVLPVHSLVTFCHDEKHRRCDINETTYTNWQKFAAKTRILMNTDPQ